MHRVIEGLAAREAEVGRALWGLEEARRRTLHRIERLDPVMVDWEAPEGGNSIGSLLYHLAAIEIDYLYTDLLELPFPQELVDLFPYEVREEYGRLTPIHGVDLQWYVHRLGEARRHVLEAYRAMNLADFRRVRHLSYADITPEWTLYHLTQHEAEHRGELAAIRARAEATRA